MSLETTVRVANSLAALEDILAGIETGGRQRPDWVHIQGRCRIDRLSEPALEALIQRLHRCTLRGFKAPKASGARKSRLAFWRCIARNGFHDFSSYGWTKCYASPFVENYDYVGAYLEGGLEGLDPYRVYTAVLGSHDYTVEDFLHTPELEKVETVVEPMAGTGEFSYAGHFRHPDLRYLLFDLDAEAREHVLDRAWLEGSDHEYFVADVLDPATWKRVKRRTRGRSLSYIGKQSHHLFGAPELHRLLEIGTRSVDYFILEAPEPSLVSDLDSVDELTLPEMEDAGFKTFLVELEDSPPNPYPNELGFRLEVADPNAKRTLFEYRHWTAWQPPMLVTLARLLDLEVLYLNDDVVNFVSIEDREHLEEIDNVSFMLFKRR